MAGQLDKLRVDAERGRQYSTSMNDLTPVFDRLTVSFRDQIEDSAFDEQDLREECYRMLKTLQLMRDLFTQVISQGTISANEIDHAAQLATGKIKEFH